VNRRRWGLFVCVFEIVFILENTAKPPASSLTPQHCRFSATLCDMNASVVARRPDICRTCRQFHQLPE
jgi:hypothetical protein